MRKPRLIYDNDARHYLTYRYDPPLSVHRLRQPVDEILGTSVDTLFYGFVSQQTYPHPAKTGLYWLWDRSERSQVMWWRAGENLKQTLESGHDPLRIVAERAHEHGIQVLSWLFWEPEDSDKPDAAPYSNHADPEVRRRRLETIEETCAGYDFDGIGLNYYVPPVVFSAEVPRAVRVPKNAPALTAFVREVRVLLDRIGKKRKRRLMLAAQIHASEQANIDAGLEIGTWLSEKLVDLVIPKQPHPNDKRQSALFDTNPCLDWLVEATHATGAWLYAPIANSLYDDRHPATTVEMYRAAATNLRASRVDGLYLSGLTWPHTANEYQVLRELGYPDVYARRTKHYVLGQRSAEPGPYAQGRQLPITLQQAVPAVISIYVGDGLDEARVDGELRRVTLGIRILQVCSNDALAFRFNGRQLSVEQARAKWIYGGSVSYAAQRGGLPLRITSYLWYDFDVPLDAVRIGANELTVTAEHLDRDMSAERVLHAVELQVFYEEPSVPQGAQM